MKYAKMPSRCLHLRPFLATLLALLASEDASLADLKEIVKQDTSLECGCLENGKILLRSGGGIHFANLDDAILRLGFSSTYKLVVTAAGGRWNSIDVSGYSWTPGDFFRHSLTVSVAARRLATELDSCEPELAYTAGLMHEAG